MPTRRKARRVGQPIFLVLAKSKSIEGSAQPARPAVLRSRPFRFLDFDITAKEEARKEWHPKDHNGREEQHQQMERGEEPFVHFSLQRSH
ncbi:MAG: hypothetical protein ACRD2U_05265 [Terriglobales bacterium]